MKDREICGVVGYPEEGRKVCELLAGHDDPYHRQGSVSWLGYFAAPAAAPLSPVAGPPRWTDQDLYDAYLHGCEDECLPEPLDKETFLAAWEDVQEVQ